MRVLIADDDPVSRRLLQVTLNNVGYETVLATDGAEALRIVEQEESPRLVVLDWIMPELDGIDVCRAIRKRDSERYFYVILLTVKGEQKEIIEGLDAGADDYVTKPFDVLELRARLRAGRRILELQQQLIDSRDRLRFDATHDLQTNLYNHGAIIDILRTEMMRAKRQATPLCFIMADLDHFKSVNDLYGHMTGDMVLREVSKRLQASVRPYDSIGRYGGEEFVIVVPGCDLEKAQSLAERLRQAVSCEPIKDSTHSIAVTASFGVSTMYGIKDPNQLIKAADEALYKAKLQGRNRVVVNSTAEIVMAGGPSASAG